MKTNDVPAHLREFHKSFMSVCKDGYKHDVSLLLSDLLDYICYYFTIEFSSEREEKNKEHLHQLAARYGSLLPLYTLKKDLILTYNKLLPNDGFCWVDPLGEYYEALASSYKKSALGQFFTPIHLVNLMTGLVLPDEDDREKVTISDPCCGSGRMLLSAYCHREGKIFAVAQDIDPICAKMAIVNFLMHGVEGVVILGDTLRLTIEKAWHVNHLLNYTGIPNVKYCTPEFLKSILSDDDKQEQIVIPSKDSLFFAV